MTLRELPEITKLLDDTSRIAKVGHWNKDLVGEKVIQMCMERKFSSVERRTIFVVVCVEYVTNCMWNYKLIYILSSPKHLV